MIVNKNKIKDIKDKWLAVITDSYIINNDSNSNFKLAVKGINASIRFTECKDSYVAEYMFCDNDMFIFKLLSAFVAYELLDKGGE